MLSVFVYQFDVGVCSFVKDRNMWIQTPFYFNMPFFVAVSQIMKLSERLFWLTQPIFYIYIKENYLRYVRYKLKLWKVIGFDSLTLLLIYLDCVQ